MLVYMVANNNLGSNSYDRIDIKEMTSAAKDGHLGTDGRLIVFHSPYNGTPMLKEIIKDGVDTLRTYGRDTLSVSIDRMRQVLADVKELSPSRSYGMVLWSHASGWLEDGIDETQIEGRSFGLDGRYKMNTTSLARALDGTDLDFIYADCCFMGSVETAYELRHAAKYIIASPTEDPVTGMPYHITLKYLFEHDYKGAAKATFDFYHSTYTPSECPISMVVVDTEKMDALAEATRAIYAQAAQPWPDEYVPQPLSLAPYYYYDLDDYVKALAGADSQLYDDWNKKNAEAVIYKAAEPWIWGEFQLTRFGGLSTFIFDSENSQYLIDKNYGALSWYADVAKTLLDHAQ